MNVGDLVIKMIEVRDLMQIYHWQTESYARHKSSDAFYASINTHMDKLMETIQNKQRFLFKNSHEIELEDVDDDVAVEILEDFVFFLENLQFNKRTDLQNIRDEILADTNQTLYIFSFE